MSVPFQYYGSGSFMSADLKQVTHRVRTAAPHLFVAKKVVETFQDGNGNITQKEASYVRATAMSGAVRHAMAMERP